VKSTPSGNRPVGQLTKEILTLLQLWKEGEVQLATIGGFGLVF
jgi:hypothetical protein